MTLSPQLQDVSFIERCIRLLDEGTNLKPSAEYNMTGAVELITIRVQDEPVNTGIVTRVSLVTHIILSGELAGHQQ